MNSLNAHTPPLFLPQHARVVLQLLEEAGFEAWVVGGFVRDSLLGRQVHDIDIATNAHWQEVQQAAHNAGLQTYETGTAHGTISVQADQHIVEVTTYREEGTYSDSRHPDSVAFVSTIEQDLARRDFTINAIAYHPQRGLCDPYHGKDDLSAGIIRAVGQPAQRFAEDALRILRAVRFASELGFELDIRTYKEAAEELDGLNNISAERIASELTALLCGKNVFRVLMDYAPIVDAVLPELAPMRGFDQKSPYHCYDIYEHTAHVVEATPATTLLRWAALLHDIGKPESFSIGPNGQGHFFGHARIGATQARHVMQRLRMPHNLTEDVCALVLFHDTHAPATHVNVKKLLRKVNGNTALLRNLFALQEADALAHAPEHRQRGELAQQMEVILDEVIASNEAFSLSDLAISGNDVIAAGVKEGPRVGDILSLLLDDVIEERVQNTRKDLLEQVQFYRER